MSSEPPMTTPLSSKSSQATPPFQYRGHDVLDLLKEARNYNAWLTDQVDRAKPFGATKIADLGAGRGTFSELLRARGLNVECVEPDTENQAVLRALGFKVFSRIEEFKRESLDYVFTLNVLEHVPDDEGLVQAVLSRLRTGGCLFIFVPAYPLLWSRLDDHVEHQRRYRRGPLVKMLQRVGFIIERAQYADSLGFFAALLFARTKSSDISASNVALYDRVLFPASKLVDPVLGRMFGKNLAVSCRKP